MMPTVFLNKSPNIRLAKKSTYTVYWRLNDCNEYVLYNYVHACNKQFFVNIANTMRISTLISLVLVLDHDIFNTI